jgi:hypothetical protein
LLIAAIGNWSGEWVVGGIEAKVISYGCGWWSLACALSKQPVRAAAWSGAAVSFHPVVGIWNTAAVALALYVTDWRIWRVLWQLDWLRVCYAGLAWLALAAPGLVPALLMLRGATPYESYAADYIQVFHRLAHHLDPWKFAPEGYWGYALLLVASCGLFWYQARSQAWNLTLRYVVVAVLIALAGCAIRTIPGVARLLYDLHAYPSQEYWQSWIEYKPHLAGLLKFYPFRLADVAVPWAASLLLTQFLVTLVSHPTVRLRLSDSQPSNDLRSQRLAGWATCSVCFAVSLFLPAIDRNPSRLPADQYADWVDACQWVERSTPKAALCYSANDGWALKWFAERADYLSHKDCPQDAPGIVAWNERLKLMSSWSNKYLADGYNRAELRELRRRTGIDYLIVRKFGPMNLEPVYRNTNFQVYHLPE